MSFSLLVQRGKHEKSLSADSCANKNVLLAAGTTGGNLKNYLTSIRNVLFAASTTWKI